MKMSMTQVFIAGLTLILEDWRVQSSQSYSDCDEYLQHSLIFVTNYHEFLNPF